jgi:hypothetical protein
VVAARLEAVGVVPEAVGAIHLHIHESVRGLPDIDPADPADRKSVQAQAVSDFCPGAHLERLRANLEPQPMRCSRPVLQAWAEAEVIAWLVGLAVCLRPPREEPR